ncbi:hypothetical protein JI664_06580 [Rhodobacter sp. NTK016B]|uniref:hypothetical protein n=1 Tax=Rhodobacter sp. NTK016B TaxID=2759676 RepID=UPI001A8DE305|nr:hypothetical protein [Rhodobacter sp. NTK016B]MBN8291622.1 hypothetical protein [Rhodobacter sp. NTK016B]
MGMRILSAGLRVPTVALALAAGAATPAGAQTGDTQASDAPCVVEFETLDVLTPAQGARRPGRVYDAWPQARGGGFVTTMVRTNNGGALQLLNHCPSGQFLALRADASVADAVLARFEEMMTSETSYSLLQMADRSMDVGALSRMGEGGVGGCDCAATGTD